MEELVVANEIPMTAIDKQEMDQSYESGFQSSGTCQETDSSWIMFKDEIADPDRFDPPINSSNVSDGILCKIDKCDISSITGDELQYKGIELFRNDRIYFAYHAWIIVH